MNSPIALTQISTSFNNAFDAAQVPLPESPKRKIRSVSLDVQGSVFIAKLNTDAVYQQVMEAELIMRKAIDKLRTAKQTCDENAQQLEQLQSKATIYTYYSTEEHKEFSDMLSDQIEQLRKVADSVFDKVVYYDKDMQKNCDIPGLVKEAESLTKTMDDLVTRSQNGTYLDSDYDSDA